MENASPQGRVPAGPAGARLLYADRAAITRRLLEEHPEWSDRLIADEASLTAKRVADIRKSASNARQPAKR